MKKLVLFNLLLSSILFSVSCKEDIQSVVENELTEVSKSSPLDQFAILLSKAVKNEANLRSFIAKEALKEIDKDHDVFYNLVKNEIVDNNKSFKDILTKYEEFPGQLLSIENEVPTLTIFVPTLPEGSFSPQNWQPSIQIPYISTNHIKENNFEFYSNGKLSLKIPADETPGFPVLVVKKNERIELKNKNIKLKSSGNNGYEWSDFAFTSEDYNGLNKTKGSATLIETQYNIDQSIKDALNLFNNDIDNWQRDYIYYGLKSANDTGKIKKNFRETIQMIKLSKDAISIISDQTEDPYLKGEGSVHTIPYTGGRTSSEEIRQIQHSAWTDGKFDFQFDILINNSNGLGTGITRSLSVSPGDLFNVGYDIRRRTNSSGDVQVITYKPNSKGIESKEFFCNIPLVNWDIQSNGVSWKIVVTEKDASETSSRKESVSSEFATNFGLDFKIGLKFGASNKETKTNEFSISTTKTSDDLGTLEMSFWEPVLKSEDTSGGGRTRLPEIKIHTVDNNLIEMAIIPTKYY